MTPEPTTSATAPSAPSAGAIVYLPIYGWRATMLLATRPELAAVGNRGAIVALAVAAC